MLAFKLSFKVSLEAMFFTFGSLFTGCYFDFYKVLITTNEPGNCLTPLNCILLLSTRFSPMGTVYKRARDCST